MQRVTYFSVKPILSRRASISLFVQDDKGELFLGPHVRLCGHIGMAHIESESLAQQFAEACSPTLQKRYGADTILEVHTWEGRESKALAQRIQRDSEIIRKRLSTGNFISNKTP